MDIEIKREKDAACNKLGARLVIPKPPIEDHELTFTKDELEIILLDMDINIKKAPPLKPSPIYVALRDKVQKMINNL